jgi:hypothetical protein
MGRPFANRSNMGRQSADSQAASLENHCACRGEARSLFGKEKIIRESDGADMASSGIRDELDQGWIETKPPSERAENALREPRWEHNDFHACLRGFELNGHALYPDLPRLTSPREGKLPPCWQPLTSG